VIAAIWHSVMQIFEFAVVRLIKVRKV